MFVPYFIVHCFVSFLVFSRLDGEERAVCLTLFVFMVSYDCYCSVALPHGALVGLQCVIVVFPDHTHLHFNFAC